LTIILEKKNCVLQYPLYTMMVFDEWYNGIHVTFIIIGNAREIYLHPILHTLGQCLPKDQMPNVIIVDNIHAKINVLRYVDLLVEHVSHDDNVVIMSIGTSFHDVFSGLIILMEILRIGFCRDHHICEQQLLPSIFISMSHFI